MHGVGRRVITRAQLRVYEADFMKFDTVNKNGVLEGEEALALARWQLGRMEQHPEIAATWDSILEQLVSEIDKNADGMIEFKEYMMWLLGQGWSVEEDAVTEATPR